MKGVGDICRGADGGEYFVEDTACLDVVLLAYSLLIITLDEGTTAVALTEADLALKGTDGDGQGEVGLQEGVR